MTFNKREIMLAAWAIVRRADRNRFPLRVILRNALRSAWSAAKSAAWDAQQKACDALLSKEARTLRCSLVALKAKDRWTQVDYARVTELHTQIARAA